MGFGGADLVVRVRAVIGRRNPAPSLVFALDSPDVTVVFTV
jgi:hypothetical protein